jgi:hypothetical protein
MRVGKDSFDRTMHALSKRSVDGTSTCPNADLSVPLSAIMLWRFA